MDFLDQDLTDLWKYRDIIVSKVNLIELMKEYNISIQSFDGDLQKIRCPFHKGKGGGRERTPSFVIYKNTNSFNCYGCGKSGSPIDFVVYADGTPYDIAIKKLGKRIGILDKDGNWDELDIDSLSSGPLYINKNINSYLQDISEMMRDYISNFIGKDDFKREFIWFERVLMKVDEFMEGIDYTDWEFAEDIFNKVKKSVDRRRNKKGLK